MSEPARRFRWGLLGTGVIAEQFAVQLARSEQAELYAVASLPVEHARAFAKDFGFGKAHESFEALLQDDDVDIVYVATPAEHHAEHCRMAIQAGKPVLCEKPLAMDASDARAIANAAEAAGLFCMEAMWMRFSPLVQRVRENVRDGKLGDIRHFSADVGYRAHESRLESGAAGRGALLNFAVYGVSLAHFLFGAPTEVRARMIPHASGLDATVAATLCYPTHFATIHASVEATMTNEAIVVGNAGRARLGAPFFNPGFLQTVDVGAPSGKPQKAARSAGMAGRLPWGSLLQGSFFANFLRRSGHLAARPRGSNGLLLEAEEAMRCLRDGKTASEVMPMSGSVAVMETLDAIRAAWS